MENRLEKEKKMAAETALKYVEDGMVLGIGSGSTVKYFIESLSKKVKEGLHITVVVTSRQTKELCEQAGIACSFESSVPKSIDLTVDGADEFDPCLNLIKGGGGCLLWEKIVASASQRKIIIVDSSKEVTILGKKFPLPIEVIPYALTVVTKKLQELYMTPKLRILEDGKPFITDEGNYILDCEMKEIDDYYSLSNSLEKITGIVEHGLFIEMTDIVIEGKGEKVETHYARSSVVTYECQQKTFAQIVRKITESRSKGEVPVIELDLDLTTFVPYNRTIKAMQAVGRVYQIKEFEQMTFHVLPGYTREAWIQFISQNRLPEKYPNLRWLGEKDGKDGESVYSVFHTNFWSTDLLASDTLIRGLPTFIRKMEKMGATVVFVSGRWLEEQIEPTRAVLKKGGLEDIPLLIGNPRHDGQNPISDSQIKALHQSKIREKYGVPTVVIDDRKENREAICQANPDTILLSVGCSLAGFSFDEEITGVQWKISDFIFS